MENRTLVCTRMAILDVQYRAQEAGAVSWHHLSAPNEEKETHTNRRKESKRKERTFHKYSDLFMQFHEQQVCFSFTSLLHLPCFLSPGSADRMKLGIEIVDIE